MKHLSVMSIVSIAACGLTVLSSIASFVLLGRSKRIYKQAIVFNQIFMRKQRGPMKINLQREWEQYRHACFGDHRLTPIQELEMYRAFFAGTLIGLNLTMDLAAQPEATAVNDLIELRNQVVTKLASLMAA
jgi:hypothetical protein